MSLERIGLGGTCDLLWRLCHHDDKTHIAKPESLEIWRYCTLEIYGGHATSPNKRYSTQDMTPAKVRVLHLQKKQQKKNTDNHRFTKNIYTSRA